MAIRQIVVDEPLRLVAHQSLIGLVVLQTLDIFDLLGLNAHQTVFAIEIDTFSRVTYEECAVIERSEVRIESGEFAIDRLA